MGLASQTSLRSKPAGLELRAADNLRFIRETMERAVAFTAVPGDAGVAIGISALITGWYARNLPLRPQFWIWALEGVLAVALGTAGLYRKSKRISCPLSSRNSRRALLSFVTPLGAGGMLTFGLYRVNQLSLFAGLWLLLYGVAVVTAGAFSVRVVPVMGMCFLCLGSFALLTPSSWSNVWMMAGFGLLHVIFGFIIARKHGG